MHRRSVLRSLGAIAVVPAAGCTAFGGTDDGNDASCREYAYSPDGTEEGPLPWDVRVANIGLSTYSVGVTITAKESEETIASCSVTSDDQRKLKFGLSTERDYTYEFDAGDLGSETREFRGLKDNEEFRVTVEDGEYTVRREHIDTPETDG